MRRLCPAVVGVTAVVAASASSPSLDAAIASRANQFYVRTPLVYSAPISTLVGKPVYLKLDALQASGSFKDRGMAHLCATLRDEQGIRELMSSSGGNAGLAAATVGQALGMTVSVIVPETTKPLVIDKLRELQASVTVHGTNWNEADALARTKVNANPSQIAYVSPYDNPLLWTGHSTIVDEIDHDLPNGVGAIVVSCGGAGLLCGILEGCQRRNKHQVKIVTCETDGASSFAQAWEKGEIVTLPGIDTVATSLGATSVTPVALERAKQHQGGFEASRCTDKEAIDACVRFAADHRILVEPACGAALAVAYTKRLREKYLSDVEGPIVLEVCGGSGVNTDLLNMWKHDFGLS